MNKIECKVCGTKFLPKKELRYTANGIRGALVLSEKEYDCFDCIKCGCQIVVGLRYAKQLPQFLSFNANEDFGLPTKILSGGEEE